SFNPASEASLNHTFTESFPFVQHAVSDTLLSIGPRATLGDRVRIVELDDGFFHVLEVKVYCAIAFAGSPVTAVIVRLTYDATGSSGRVAFSNELIFQDGSPTVQTFRTVTASAEARSYHWSSEVRYRGAPNVTY